MLQAGEHLGSYQLIAPIGAGGMGEVWKAEDTRLGRAVAIKILPPAIAADPEALARMRREARTAAQLNHPNIATIHSFEQDGDRMFIVMELVDGEPLTARIARGPMPEAEISRIGRGVADALSEAHAKSVVHRDIKPDNIIVTDSRVKVLDFGIAKRIGLETMASETPTAFITQQGMILGTVQYMSPEQAMGKPVDERTDLFSLGVVLYQMATGKQPFSGETITETMAQIIRDEPAEPRRVNPAISAGLNSIIQRCLKKNREERFPTAAALAAALAEGSTRPYTAPRPTVMTAATSSPPRARRSSGLWIAIAMLVVAGGIAAVYSTQHRVAAVPPPAAPSTTTMEVATQSGAPAHAAEVGGATPTDVKAQGAPPTTSAGDDKHAAGRSSDVPLTPAEQFNRAMDALFSRNLGIAERRFRSALEHPNDLTAHQRQVAALGLAIATNNREQAQQIAREMHQENPGDPDLLRIRRTFPLKTERVGEGERGGRRRWKPRSE